MLILDGKPLSYDRAFTHDGIQYPANWLRLSSLEEKTAIGITEVPGPTPYDQRFYWGPDLPKDHEGLVTLWINNTNHTAYTLLAPSDWYVIRQQETEVAVPQDVLDRRGEIRTYCDTKREAISATTTTDELAAYITSAAYSEWEEPAPEPTPEPTPEEIVETPEGDVSNIFSGGSILSGGITAGFSEDTISFS
tara:strand:+ start:251 stop:829 length:579 start_codon:yes stop_codon:yes gene_type:complete